MFGRNAVSKPFNQDGHSLLVNDVFYTIQGEGPDAGVPSVFVRLAKCNLRCHFCDTEFESGELLTVMELTDRVLDSFYRIRSLGRLPLVVITGGEPLLQNIAPFVIACNNLGHHVSVETAGTVYNDGLWMSFFGSRNKIIVSPKTPTINSKIKDLADAFKYIIKAGAPYDPEDGLPITNTQRLDGGVNKLAKPRTYAPVFIQPMDEQDTALTKLNETHATQICMKYGYRLSLQVHKIVGLP